MAYDEDVANRIREVMSDAVDYTEMKMFGGLAFLVGGHMAVAASGQGGLMVRLDPDQADQLADTPHAEPFEMRGRPMKGWLHIAAAGCDDDADLQHWVALGVTFASSLPPK